MRYPRSRCKTIITACYEAYTLRAYTLTTWRERVKKTTGEDPLVCPWCEKEMVLVERAYRARDGPGLVVKNMLNTVVTQCVLRTYLRYRRNSDNKNT